MNERIKELAKQANIEFTYDSTETPMRVFAECWEDELEKFAESIIMKCCEIANESEKADLPVYASKFIKAHFGIER